VTALTIWIVMCFFLALGVFGLVAPARLIKPFRIVAETAESRAEIRAVYGGFGVAISVVLALAALDIASIRRGALVAVAAALLGMAIGRVVSRVVDGPQRWYPIWVYFWVELMAAGLLAVAVQQQ